MPEKMKFCANLGVRSRAEKDAAIAADAGSVGRNVSWQSKREGD